MGALAELDNSLRSDQRLEELQIGEVRIRRIRGADGDVVVLEPPIALGRLPTAGSHQDECNEPRSPPFDLKHRACLRE
jgi:hypothetical protein